MTQQAIRNDGQASHFVVQLRKVEVALAMNDRTWMKSHYSSSDFNGSALSKYVQHWTAFFSAVFTKLFQLRVMEWKKADE